MAKTCDRCTHYSAEPTYNGRYPPHGNCDKTIDWNDVHSSHTTDPKTGLQTPVFVDQCAGSDYESYSARVYVAPKFGCIHWAKITPATAESTT